MRIVLRIQGRKELLFGGKQTFFGVWMEREYHFPIRISKPQVVVVTALGIDIFEG